jgi:hypothetical protein
MFSVCSAFHHTLFHHRRERQPVEPGGQRVSCGCANAGGDMRTAANDRETGKSLKCATILIVSGENPLSFETTKLATFVVSLS